MPGGIYRDILRCLYDRILAVKRFIIRSEVMDPGTPLFIPGISHPEMYFHSWSPAAFLSMRERSNRMVFRIQFGWISDHLFKMCRVPAMGENTTHCK